jgi:hypothetical protein
MLVTAVSFAEVKQKPIAGKRILQHPM